MSEPNPRATREALFASLDGTTIERAVAVARHLMTRAAALQTRVEKRQQAELERMLQSDDDRATLTQMTDQAFRAKTPGRVADQLTHILDVQGVPRFFGAMDRTLLKGFQSFGGFLPGVSVPLVKDKMREETANVVLPGEIEHLRPHLEARRGHGVRMNVNFLGEALLGETDAKGRLRSYLAALQEPSIEVISVKVSTIYSQITPINRRHATDVLCDRMELLYRAAMKATFERADGTIVPKFVYLDMEEFRDLEVTVDTFLRTLARPGLEQAAAGIALQAYVPDSFAAQQRINAFARERVAKGGAPITYRLVKGANMEAERVEASVAGWPLATYSDKRDTDANYKRMLHEALLPENLPAIRIGVATHNIFEAAYALVLGAERGALGAMQFEMLEGMANHQRRAVSEIAEDILLYAPATKREEFINAIGYLIRRMDENTGPDNFLRHAFKLEVGSEEWDALERGFVESFARIESLSVTTRRTQDRNATISDDDVRVFSLEDFENESDTDFSLEQNLAWAEGIIARWSGRVGDAAADIPAVVAGEELRGDRPERTCKDPSRPDVIVGRYRQAKLEDVDRALSCAKADPTGWRTRPEQERAEILARAALELRRARGDLMGAALANGGKLLTESDPEVSEAIDFVNYYPASARALAALPGVEAQPKGVVVVVPPWNFPIAIPCGGVAAGLASGNTVILKPASNVVLIAWELCQAFWRAGVPKEALQFVPCAGATGGARLVASASADAVILTGGTDTALRMLDAKPDMFLLAETGGKNATIVTAMSDREQAIKHVLHSAFSHSGQKCSATSLLILEGEVFDDSSFEATLCDAVKSMKVGSAWALDTKMGPVVMPPSGDLERGLKELEDGERWAVLPERRDGNPCLWSPGVKWGVSPGSYTHMTEFFGPVLAVMRADDLHHAIELVNQTGYGLTSGIESLDAREREQWLASIRAGNLYVNRVTTGAIVERQPFGGVGKSAFGPGIKAGGPNYVAQLMDFEDAPAAAGAGELENEHLRLLVAAMSSHIAAVNILEASDVERIHGAMLSYDRNYRDEFARPHDRQRLVGQDNYRRYNAVPALRVRVHEDDSTFDVYARVAAARVAGCRVTVSTPPGLRAPAVALLDELTDSWAASIEFVEETEAELVRAIEARQMDRIRYAKASRVPIEVRRALGDSGIYVADAPVLGEGRIELLWYLSEQSVSDDYHRYGNLGARGAEERRPVT